MKKTSFTTVQEVWRWPEFLAFAKRIGIDCDKPTINLNIAMRCDDFVIIDQRFFVHDPNED